MKDDIVYAKFGLKVPKGKLIWKINQISSDLDIKILSMLLLHDKTGNILMQIKGKYLQFVKPKIFKILKGLESNILIEEENLIHLTIKMKDPWILRIITTLKLLVRYPLIIENNYLLFELVENRSKIDKLFNLFENEKFTIKLHQIGYYKQKKLLTPRQDEVLKKLWKGGYFELPHRMTLRQHSQELGISVSALSELLRRIQKKLVKVYFEEK